MPQEIENQNDPNDPNQNQQADPPNPSIEPVKNPLEDLIKTTIAENERARAAAEQRARDAEDELQRLRNQNNKPADTTSNLTSEDFFKDPVAIINKLVSDQVRPLNEAAENMRIQREYDTLKQGYRQQYPAFAQIENLVDQFMRGKPRNHEGIQAAIREAVGHLALTNPAALNPTPNPDPTKEKKEEKVPNNSQAHLRPSASPSLAPSSDNNKKRPLTENERRLLRENNMTEERYWQLMDAPTTVDSFKEEKKK